MRNFILFFFILRSISLSFAQTGPGGVGNTTNIEAWLDASTLSFSNGASVNTWADSSGNGNDAVDVIGNATPTFEINQINGHPVVDFSSNAVLEFNSNISTLETTIFSVHNSPAGSGTSPFSLSNHLILESTDKIFPVYYTPLQYSTRISKARNSFSVFSLSSAGGVSGANFTLTNNANSISGVRSQGAGLSSSTIGCRNSTTYEAFSNNKVAELIIFNEKLNSAKRKIVGNYLAGKYNLTAEQNLYAYGSAHGRDVIGIGQETDGSHLESRGLDSLKISNASTLGNGDYLLVGNDGGSFGASVIGGAFATQRWTKVWRADVTGTPGTVDLTFYLGSNDFATSPNDYAVLIDNVDGVFTSGGTSIQETGRVYDATAKTVTFTGITLTDGDYFTLAEKRPPPVTFFKDFGPGGIGNTTNIEAWLDASTLSFSNGASVSNWADSSGNGNDAIGVIGNGTPTFQTNEINGHPVIDFSSNAILEFLSNISTLETTIFSVHNSPAGSGTSPFSLSNHLILESTDKIFPIYYNPLQYATRISKARNSFSVFSLSSEGGVSGANFTLTNSANSISGVRNQGAGLSSSTIGCRNSSTYEAFSNNKVAELIIFNEKLNSAKRKIVSNYLATKYNLTPEQNLYAYGSTHDRDVIGIGQELDGSHLESRGLDSLKINNASALGDGDYILVGNDAGSFGASASAGAFATQRWTKIWRTGVTGTPGTIDLTFYLGTNDFAVDPNDYAVLIENVDGDFTNGGTSIQETGRVYDAAAKTVTFTGITLNDGDYFTLAEKDLAPNAIANGNWESTATWSCGCIPLATLDVTIPSPFDVTINDLADAKSLTIASGGSLTFAGSDTLQLVEDLTIIGTLTSGTGTLLGNGTSSQTFSNSSGSNVALNNLVANNSISVVLTGGWSLSNNLHVSSGTLDVTGADSLVLLSNASKTAQILESVDGAFTGNFTVQRHISSRDANFGLVSSPINNATVAELDDDILISGIGGRSGNSLYSNGNIFYTMFGYNRNTSKKDTIASTSFTMVNGEGYELYLASTSSTFNGATIDYIGTPNDGNIVPNTINQGFNLVGNPYQSFIGFDNLDRSNIDDNYWLYDTDAGSFISVAGGTGGTIAPGQGFWVNKASTGDVAFDFEESDKVSSTSSTFVRKRNGSGLTVKIENSTNGFSHQVMLETQFAAENGIDVLDARYLPSPLAEAPGIYFTLNEDFDHLVKNTISLNQDHYEVDLAIETGLSGNYALSFENLTTLGNQFSCIKIYDKIADVLIDLNQEDSYSFEANKGKTNRFKLILANSNVDCDSQSIETSVASSDALQLINKSGLWFVNYDLDRKEQFNISVFSLTGQLVKNISSTNLEGSGSIQISNLDNLKGVYLLQIKGSKNQINQTIKF
jgi:hypothetical protein